MKAVKVNNPSWLPVIAPRIAEYAKIIASPGVTYETLYAYFAQSVQFGKDLSEFWVVFDENDEAVAFASWMVLSVPYTGKAYFDHIYKWSKSKKPVRVLIEKFTEFCTRNRCTLAAAELANEKVFEIFSEHGKQAGWELSPVSTIRTVLNFYPEKAKDEGLQQNSD